jgi:hypothetical protein
MTFVLGGFFIAVREVKRLPLRGRGLVAVQLAIEPDAGVSPGPINGAPPD